MLDGHALAHLDGRAAMVETDDDDFFLHGLFIVGHAARSVEPYCAVSKGGEHPLWLRLLKPAPMPAWEHGIAQKEITEDDTEPDHGQKRRLLAAQAGGNPAVQNPTVKQPGDA